MGTDSYYTEETKRVFEVPLVPFFQMGITLLYNSKNSDFFSRRHVCCYLWII